MKKLAVMLIAAATLGLAVPASAQVAVGVGDVGVRIGSDYDRYDRHHAWRDRQHVADCRVIKERTVTPRGRVIVETRRICD
jgi:hypothetical protein